MYFQWTSEGTSKAFQGRRQMEFALTSEGNLKRILRMCAIGNGLPQDFPQGPGGNSQDYHLGSLIRTSQVLAGNSVFL